MDFYKKFTSNTLAGSGNQLYFYSDDENALQRGRVCYKVFKGGEFNYSFLFSNVIDSTFGRVGDFSCNYLVEPWEIVYANALVIKNCDENFMDEPTSVYPLTFNGNTSKRVERGDLFYSDAVKIFVNEGEYICLEVAFKGRQIPYHEESIIPCFALVDGKWQPSKRAIFAPMVGCDREVKKKIAFIGDSITQGIGTEVNSYNHYMAVVADVLGKDYAYWNLGLGYGKVDDVATDGAWLAKAKQNDIVSICFGVNDIWRGYTAEQIKFNLEKVVDILKNLGIKVILQTIPPFNFYDQYIGIWKEVNEYLRTTLSKKVDLFFDDAILLKKSDEEEHIARYGDHPNAEGCKVWGEALADKMQEFLQSI